MKNIILLFTALVSALNLMGSAVDTTAAASSSQKAINLKKADNLFGKQNYAAAIEMYNKAWQSNPTNPNLNFKLGLCWHYLLQNPQLCQALFANAIQYTDSKYNFYSSKETKASDDALYYLGKTYLNLNSSDSAIICLAQYQNKLRDNLPLDAGRQLVMCLNYNQLINQPRQLKITPLRGEINSKFSDANPVLSIDGKILFMSSRRPGMGEHDTSLLGDNDIYVAYRNDNGELSAPMPFDNNSNLDEEPLYINLDGNKLYLRQQQKNGTGDILFAERLETSWSKPQKLKGVNTSADENGIAFSADGNYMVVSSNRPGGYGGYDLYISKKKGDKWGALVNMGAKVNSEMDELSPHMHPTENRLYFSSNGNTPYGMGGFDVLFTQRDSASTWSNPFTMGYPVNTGNNELGYYVTANGGSYYATVNEQGNFDIYEITVGEFEKKIEDKIVTVIGTETVTEVQLLEVEKEKLVEVDKEVVVTKIEEVEKEVEKNVGMVTAAEAKKLDKVVAVEEKEIAVETIVETEKIVYTNKTDKEIDSINNANSLNPPVQVTDNATSGSASSSGSAVSSDPLANYKVETNVSYTPASETNQEVTPVSNGNKQEVSAKAEENPKSENAVITDNSNPPSTNSKPETATINSKSEIPNPKSTISPPAFKTVTPINTQDKNLIRPKVVSVPAGVPLETVAETFDVSVKDIRQWNKLQSSTLSAETPLIVGYEYNSEIKDLLASEQLKLAGIEPGDREAIIANIKKYYEDKMNNGNSTIFKNLYFEFNSNKIDMSGTELSILVNFLKEHKDIKVECVGHTDNVGAWETNFWVSRERARTIYQYLIDNGVSTSRIIFNGKGSTEPVESNYTIQGRAKNRRVEVKLIK